MAAAPALHDPLRINLASQTKILLSKLGNDSAHAQKLQRASTRLELLHLLSTLLSTPGLTALVATTFRPILLDLSARFLQEPGNWIAKLEALSLLVGVHPEIYPVLSVFLKWPQFYHGPLSFIKDDSAIQNATTSDLQHILLAYYRLLQANRDLPRSLGWQLAPLSRLMWGRHPSPGVRFLAVQCYALQTGMIEGERGKIEKEIIGELASTDCPIDYATLLDGTVQTLDGWLLHMTEATRLLDARNELLISQKYYETETSDSVEPIHSSELSPLIANMHGVLMLRSSGNPQSDSPLISTPTTMESLRTLALHISMGVPTLLTSSPSSGKSLLLSHLATVLYPQIRNQIVTIHLADTSLDPRSLLGSYISSPTRPGTFDWKEGVLVRAMREGRWVVFEDIDRASNEVLGMIKPLTETLAEDKWVGGRASMEVPGRGRIEAEESFKIFATRSLSLSRNGGFSSPTFFGAHIFREIIVPSPTHADLRMIVDTRYPRLAGAAAEGLISLWEAIRVLGSTSSTRDVGLRELEKLCTRVDKLLPPSHAPIAATQSRDLSAIFTNPTLREDIFMEARDVFFGAGATNATARSYYDSVAATVAEHLGLSPERRDWAMHSAIPEFSLEKDVNGSIAAVRLGRTRLGAASSIADFDAPVARPFAMHKPAISLLSRIATAISLGEPVLLTGETGTGKTSVVTHLASLLRKPLISLNLSNQTESADIVGGFKPVDARVPASQLQQRFLDLFGGTFSRKKNAHFEESVRRAVQEGKWKRVAGLWLEACRLARDRIRAKVAEESVKDREGDAPRKRRKVEQGLNIPESQWADFEQDVRTFEVQHVHGNGKFAFGFVEGPLVKALRAGHWILLDEVNLASPETLECISSLLHGPTASITLTEQGSLEPIPRHPEFRLFACMNPATDVGKKDLPPNIRSRFTEIDVPPPDADKETLLSIVSQYIGHCAVGDMGVIMDVAEFYTGVRVLAERRELADGSNHKPHFSMRTLARALTFASDLASAYSLRRSLWEGCLMAFTMSLDDSGAKSVTSLAQKYILSGVRNPRSLLSKEPSIPTSRKAEEFVKFGPFYLERGPLPEDSMDEYIMTPSVEKKLVDLARILVTRRFPVLIEGPTSAGKTSSIEYLAKRTGHRFVRINNHEHTDIQEYLGTYVSDPTTGKLVFRDGLLVRALREGDWIVLDELNLAPTDVLEALNRLLDDNRELVIPETQEVVRPHPHFMLFATQNPPGLYAGRKVLSRAFRNRFLEVHFEDVPQAELEAILCQRCRIAPSYGQRIVAVFRELQKRRQSSRIFESKHGFATLRDLFRWAGRDAIDYQELADNGYMLLAERARKDEDKQVVKEIIESIMKVSIDPQRLYNLQLPEASLVSYLGCPLPRSTQLVWTSALQRLFILVARALRFKEPVLLVGETGCGKTSVCQLYAEVLSKTLYSVNCHQNTETADLIGGMRPVRNRGSTQMAILRDASLLLESLGHAVDPTSDVEVMIATIDRLLKTNTSADKTFELQRLRSDLRKSSAMFEWHDGPLVDAMRRGDVFLMDEISLADDSVLERLNSVLETGRTIVLAERGGEDSDILAVQADEEFKLVATMNPGGDYGKKELSPALRNRFTEIWVPPVDSRHDLELIVGSLWRHDALKCHTTPLLDFAQWLSETVSDVTLVGLRDILAWVEFSNAVYGSSGLEAPPLATIFHHAARMTLLDGLGSLPQLSSYTPGALSRLQETATAKLQKLVPMLDEEADISVQERADHIQLGPYAIPRGPAGASASLFSFGAPTTRDNVMRVIRACQLPKPILLEGSPGVGKTSLVSALANICGYELCRINLSDQTDLVDLFGSDLPVEGGAPGEFAWKDAEFLRALQEGRWVLLDEMNLAPQAVLEGLNAVLDHRGTVYIPELGRSFTRHPSFRIFAAQNPLHQGGGRKGLPKSFLNRFTKVFVQELTNQDVLLVCRNLFPTLPDAMLRGMIDYTTRLHEEVMVKRTFGRDGSPWEFNLRDVIRWGSLLQNDDPATANPLDYLNTLFLQRFRVAEDRRMATNLFRSVFEIADEVPEEAPTMTVSPNLLQIGGFVVSRAGSAIGRRAGVLLQAQLSALESVAACVTNDWLTILTGPRRSGKSSLVRLLAHLTGQTLYEIPINNATDAADILGSFEELDTRGQAMQYLERLDNLLNTLLGSQRGSQLQIAQELVASIRTLTGHWSEASYDDVREISSKLLQILTIQELDDSQRDLISALNALLKARHSAGRFAWVDGPLVRALKHGLWVCLDGANLCNPSVLDRLNSLCEKDGCLILNERGAVNGEVETIKPHPNFRLFMCVDSHYGELSRAMRNRGVEVALVPITTSEDIRRISSYYRLPAAYAPSLNDDKLHLSYEYTRRGIAHAYNDTPVTIRPSRLLIAQDSVSSSLLELTESLRVSADSDLDALAKGYFTSSVVAPNCLPLLCRFVRHYADTASRPLSFVFSLMQSRVLRMTYEARQLCPLVHPLELLLAQPMDLQMTHLSPKLEANLKQALPSMALLLRLFVTLATSVIPSLANDIVMSTIDHVQMNVQDRIVSAIQQLVGASNAAAQRICESVTLEEQDARDNIELSLRLLSCTAYLAEIASQDILDYSAVLLMANMLDDAFTEPRDIFSDVVSDIKQLKSLVSPRTGLGLLEIWTSLLQAHITVQDQVLELQRAAYALPLESRGLRNQILQVMALSTLRVVRSSEENEAMQSLVRQTEKQLKDIESDTAAEQNQSEDPLLLVNELKLLATYSIGSHASDESVKGLQNIIDTACQNPGGNLSRIVHYQHLLWEIQAEQSSLGTVAGTQRSWLEAVWTLQSHGQRHGPAMLLTPIALLTSVADCQNADKTLLSIDVYEDTLRRRLRSVCGASTSNRGRLSNIANLAARCLLSIVSCFRSTFDPTAYEEIMALAHSLGQDGTLSRLLARFEETKHGGLKAAVQQYLKPVIMRLDAANSNKQDGQLIVGELWVAIAQMLVELFVPNTPIDPALLQQRALQFRQKETLTLQAQIDMHKDLELRTTGNVSNGTIQFLEALLSGYPVPPISAETQIPHRGDLHRLQSYWAEVLEFLTRVVPASRIQSLLSAADSKRPNLAQLEHVVQESISAFCQRLNGMYQDFDDISAPIHTALLGMRLGLRLVVDAAMRESSSTHAQTAGTLLTFPSISSAEGLRATIASNASNASFDLLIIKLAGILVETNLLGTVQPYVHRINELYEQATGLWLIECARAEEKEREAQTLYRNQGETDEISEAAAEEAEFLAIFPEFGDVLGDEDTADKQNIARSGSIIRRSGPSQLFEMHLGLFLQKANSANVLSRYSGCRRTLLMGLIESEVSQWPEEFDVRSVAFQTTLLHDRLQTLHGTTIASHAYDFYHDENVLEAKKAASVLKALSSRLDSLISQWPDQMVLQHLKSRCDVTVKIPLDSPVAKILSALELLLLQLEDWEMYANRENSLKSNQHAMIELIVSWRRMELSAWQGLLDSQAATFVDSTADWWFRLYNAAVRGVISATQADAEQGSGTANTDKFLDDLVPLLDDFMSHGPIGQFTARLQLLHSMENFVDSLLKSDVQQVFSTLSRVHRVLHFTRCYYEQFETKIARSIADQRAVLEKTVQDFIKLASWKDINVQALRQSAQKTHRHLYKTIRKYRDILRQPVDALLQPAKSSHALKHDIPDDHTPLDSFPRASDFPDFPDPSSLDRPLHLLNLANTYRNYTGLINDRLLGSLESRMPLSVESFAEDIITTSKALAESVIPANLEASRRTALQKNLLTRKRKAWSDLLKELKRAGISANVKPEVLELTRSQRRIREQIPISVEAANSTLVRKGEDYFYRLTFMLPQLRGCLSDHNSDLSTRELQRAVMHIESCFALALQSRTCLGHVAMELEVLSNLHRRLMNINTDPRITGSGPTVRPYVTFAKSVVSGLASGLQEVFDLLTNLQASNPVLAVPPALLEEISGSIGTLRDAANIVSQVLRCVGSSDYGVLLNGEHVAVKSALAQVSNVVEMVERWCSECPHLAAFIRPVGLWLSGKQTPVLERLIASASDSPVLDQTIDSVLLNVQAMLKTCTITDNLSEDDERDNYVKDDCRFVCTLSEKLNLERLADDVQNFVRGLSFMTADDIKTSIARLSPFLDRYLSLGKAQIATQAGWTKSLFKLAYILSTLVSSVANDGFCRPQDGEGADGDGEGQEAGEGVGMGEGSGSENVSKEIQEESQVEGLQGEETAENEKVERAEEGNAVEMSEDFGGDLQDVPPDEEEQEEQSGDESEGEPDEQLAELDGGDENEIDEKLWGDEQGPEDKDNGGKTDKDHSKQDSGPSETVAKEGEDVKNDKKELPNQEQKQEQPAEEGPDATPEDEETPGPDGAPLDQFAQDAETLDLPDNMELDGPEKEETEGGIDEEDDLMDDQPEEGDNAPEPGSPDGPPDEDDAMDIDSGMQQAAEEDAPEGQAPEEEMNEDVVAQPDTHAGDGAAQDPSAGDAASAEATDDRTTEGQKPEQSAGEVGTTPGEASKLDDETMPQSAENEEASEKPQAEPANAQPSDEGGSGTQKGASNAAPRNPQPLSNNPLRSLGDALREISQRFSEIVESEADGNADRQEAEPRADKNEASQLEYIREDDTADDMQALGPAGEEREAKLRELNLVDDEEPLTDRVAPLEEDAMDIDSTPADMQKSSLEAQETSESLGADMESALTPAEVRGSRPSASNDEPATIVPDMQPSEETENAEDAAELELKQWQAEGQPTEQAEQIWRRYESLTHDLSYTLCEQLRLILEPTMATRLKGDYRTGKRLNMKKIIPYIASEYTKDKIWLRRTRPSQREYQVLIALDDSKSMAESHSVHLAFQTLALVSKALSRLEVGDVAIAKFGKSVDVLHGFDAPFTDQAGTKIMGAFKFNQQATQVQSLLEASLTLLEQARERRAMSSSSAADLWQMEIIISDGICQDHERLRGILRKAEEQRVMVVFIILDSLHTNTSTSASGKGTNQSSILSMNQVAYKEVDGRMDLSVTRYLDTFPFEYYVVVRNVEALPDVLAGTLKQFFERISEE